MPTLRSGVGVKSEIRMLEIGTLGWAIMIGLIVVLLGVDLMMATLRPHAVGFREAAAWSLFYLAVGAVPTLEGALYFSSITYGTIGYSDAAIAIEWRLVAAFEGIAGIILLGWSTAFFVRLLGRSGTH